MVMYLEIEKEDLLYIGDSTYQSDDGYCVFVFYDAFDISRILLRNLLKMMGDQYRILDEEEYVDEQEGFIIHIFTNLPWDVYMKAALDNDDEVD